MKTRRRFTGAVIGTACLVLLGTTGTETGGTVAAAATSSTEVLHFGPMGLQMGQRAVLFVTNLTQAPDRPTLAILGEDGQILRQRRLMIEPGDSSILTYRESDFAFRPVRGRVLIPSGSPEEWPAVLHILGQPDFPVVLTSFMNTVFDDMASSAPVASRWDDLGVPYVLNLSAAMASYTVTWVDSAGNCVAQAAISDVPPGAIGSTAVDMDLGKDLRIQVDSMGDTPFVASAEHRLHDGTLIEHADIRYPSIIIVVC